METRVPADDGAWQPPARESGDDALDQRLAAIEARLAALESSLNDVVAQGLQTTGEEMRRAVSDLGRLLLRDLDRLTKVLAEHRDMIVERLTPEPLPAETEPPAAPEDAAPTQDESPRLAGEEGRWKAFAPRRRGRRNR